MKDNSLENKLSWKDAIPGYSTYAAVKYNLGSKFATRKENIAIEAIFDTCKILFYFLYMPVLAYEGLVGF